LLFREDGVEAPQLDARIRPESRAKGCGERPRNLRLRYVALKAVTNERPMLDILDPIERARNARLSNRVSFVGRRDSAEELRAIDLCS